MPSHFRSSAAILLLATLWSARADASPATAPAARTADDLVEPIIELGRTYYVRGYATLGHRDPRWDADAVRLIEAVTHDAACVSGPGNGRRQRMMTAPDLAALARRVLDSGCDDAVALQRAAVALLMAEDFEGATTAIARAEAAAPTSPYPPVVQLHVALFDEFVRQRFRLPAASPRICELFRAVLGDRELQKLDRRLLWNFAAGWPSVAEQGALVTLGETIEPMNGIDPWLYHTLMGRVEIARAWAKDANATDADAQWQAFRAHLVAAREHLRLAIDADDAEPEPYAFLVLVGAADRSGTARGWFDLAVARQFDVVAAYDHYFLSLTPAWGGSVDAVLQAANEAIDTGRFDTRVPAMGLRAMQILESTLSPGKADVPRLAEVAFRCADGYLAAEADAPDVVRWARSLRAAWSARLGRFDEVATQFAALDAANQSVSVEWFREFKLDLAEVRQRAAATSQPAAAQTP